MKLLLRNIINLLSQRSQEGINFFWDFLKPTPSDQIHLLIFCQGRTGSTLLESLLASTGYFCAHGELFNIPRKGKVLCPAGHVRGLSKRTARAH